MKIRYLGTIPQLIECWEKEVKKIDEELSNEENISLEKKKQKYIYHIKRLKRKFGLNEKKKIEKIIESIRLFLNI